MSSHQITDWYHMYKYMTCMCSYTKKLEARVALIQMVLTLDEITTVSKAP